MTSAEQSALGIIGGADGPTAIVVSDFPTVPVIIGIIIVGIILTAAIVALIDRNR